MQLFSNFVKAKNSMGEFILIPQKKFETSLNKKLIY